MLKFLLSVFLKANDSNSNCNWIYLCVCLILSPLEKLSPVNLWRWLIKFLSSLDSSAWSSINKLKKNLVYNHSIFFASALVWSQKLRRVRSILAGSLPGTIRCYEIKKKKTFKNSSELHSIFLFEISKCAWVYCCWHYFILFPRCRDELHFRNRIQMNKLQDAVFFHESVTRLKYLHTAVINP